MIRMIKAGCFTLICISLLIGCGGEVHPDLREAPEKESQILKMGELDFVMRIPKGFTTVEEVEMIENLEYAEENEAIKAYHLNRIESFFREFPDAQVLLSPFRQENMLVIIKQERPIGLSKVNIKYYAQNILEGYLNSEMGITDIKLLENKFIIRSWYKYCKVKFAMKQYGEERYASYFLVSSERNAFGAFYESPDMDDDLQAYVNTLKFSPAAQ